MSVQFIEMRSACCEGLSPLQSSSPWELENVTAQPLAGAASAKIPVAAISRAPVTSCRRPRPNRSNPIPIQASSAVTVTALGGAVSDPTRARTYHYQREQAKHQPKGPRARARWLPGFVQHPPADDPVSGLIADRLGYETRPLTR